MIVALITVITRDTVTGGGRPATEQAYIQCLRSLVHLYDRSMPPEMGSCKCSFKLLETSDNIAQWLVR
mgnify:CR=1 FL=1